MRLGGPPARHFEPVQLLLDSVKGVVADLTIRTHGEDGPPGSLDGFLTEIATRGQARSLASSLWPLGQEVPEEEWRIERDRDRLAAMVTESAKAVRDAVQGRVLAGRDLALHYDHPILMLQLLLWHEGYHHGQIKLALKLAGRPIHDDDAGPITWDVWRRRRSRH